ncbi:MAG TPA: hypothetical protein DE312_11840 [Gallionella sp.]|nr:MAG: hypothetical protein A2Z87_10465 [Gallionellales bacterium GWA2_54_124]OGT19095.1 MAG: hypothetical protein A2522_05475 [Gallionellales bacterium RIFOXYD12_FULL_53_10]OGT36024.1 MAG: hypothetical protein A3K00_03990 [Gallionellales bacterium RIFOXYD2_FULL_52_7]HCI53984.1 hypothetical protein [Gallionella sp.]
MEENRQIYPEQFKFQIQSIKEKYPQAFLPSDARSGLPQAIIGIGALTHDTSAALVSLETGKVIYAVAEERLSNVKHDSRFPIGAIEQCCQAAEKEGFTISQVAVNFHAVEFITKTLKNEISVILNDASRSEGLFAKVIDMFDGADSYCIGERNQTSTKIEEELRNYHVTKEEARQLIPRLTWYFNAAIKYQKIGNIISELFNGLPVTFINHHECHAASAFFDSGFKDATVLVIDGHGEADTVSIYKGDSKGLTLVSQSTWPHSAGAFYLAATRHLGFDHGDEYKVMGMAAYGQPKLFSELAGMMDVGEDAVLRLVQNEYFVRRDVAKTGHTRFHFTEAMGHLIAARKSDEPFEQKHFDFAATVQKITEDIGVRLAQRAVELTGERNIAIAGGVGLNGLMNEAIRSSGSCDEIFIYPAASDDGTSVGAAHAYILRSKDIIKKPNRLRSCYFGHNATDEEIKNALNAAKVKFSSPDSINKAIALALADGKIVARYNGPAEFGPRALGNRSILANPAKKDMKDILNLRVKHREEFRPFAPACLREKVDNYFEINTESPFMLLIAKAKKSAHKLIPSVVHADGTARVQTVTPEQNEDFYATIKEVEKLTGIPVVINTSFNVNGETIVDEPLDAIESFGFMDIDFLAIGKYWVSKVENASLFPPITHDEYLGKRKERYRRKNLDPLSELNVRAYGPWFFFSEQKLNEYLASLGFSQEGA